MIYKAWLLFFLGSVAYFLYKYNGRKDKDKPFSFKYWLADNSLEFVLTFIFNFAAMIILVDSGTSFDLARLMGFLPEEVELPSLLLVSFFLGYGGGWAIYNGINQKVSKRHG